MEIIPAEEKHIPEIVELWIEFMGHHRDIDPRFPMREEAPAGFEKHLIELMNAADTQTLVAVDNDRVVGFAISVINKYPPIWEREIYGAIDMMAVRSGYRRKKVGEKLLQQIFHWFEMNDIDRIELSVSTKNEVGYSFWKKHGFKDYIHRLYLDR